MFPKLRGKASVLEYINEHLWYVNNNETLRFFPSLSRYCCTSKGMSQIVCFIEDEDGSVHTLFF